MYTEDIPLDGVEISCACSRAHALHAANIWSSYKHFWWHLADDTVIRKKMIEVKIGTHHSWIIPFSACTTSTKALTVATQLSGTTTRTLLSLMVAVHTSHWTTKVLKFALSSEEKLNYGYLSMMVPASYISLPVVTTYLDLYTSSRVCKFSMKCERLPCNHWLYTCVLASGA